MAKKRVKKTKSRRSSKRKSIKVSAKTRSVIASRRKLQKVGINLIIFVVLAIVSWFISAGVSSPTTINLFFLLTWIFGFISVALLIVFLLLWLMRAMNK
jgi:fatty-acid desaturase